MKWRLVGFVGTVTLLAVFSMWMPNRADAELSQQQFAFSRLFQQADAVVAGYVSGEREDPRWHLVTLQVQTVIRGVVQDTAILVGSPKGRNGGRLADEAYPWTTPMPLTLFLHFDTENDLWRIVNGEAGLMLRETATSDIQAISRAYEENSDLFQKGGSVDLQSLFFSSQDVGVKNRILYDLENTLTDQNIGFLSTLINSEEKTSVTFAALMVGRLRLESLRTRVEGLTSSNDKDITFHAIVGLGDLGNPDSRPLVLSHLGSPSPAIRRASVEAAGKIGGLEIVDPLKISYRSETDIGDRIAIITSITRLSDGELVKNTLRELQTIETDSLVNRILAREIDRRG